MSKRNLPYTLERRCVQCGKLPPRHESSNENWNAYDCSQKCDCGGSFGTYINGELCAPEKYDDENKILNLNDIK